MSLFGYKFNGFEHLRLFLVIVDNPFFIKFFIVNLIELKNSNCKIPRIDVRMTCVHYN